MKRDVPLVAFVAAAWGTYLHWPALVDPYRFHNNWRQAPHWISPARQFFHADDELLRFAEFNTSPFADLLYQTLALTGHDLIWGKLNAILFFTAYVTLASLIGRTMGGRTMGWVTAVSLMLFPNMFQEFGGGFMDGLSASLLCLTMLVIVRRKWAWAVPLMAFQSVTYPMVALLSGMVLLVDAILHDGRRWFDARQWRRKYLFLAAAAGVAAGIIAWKYLGGHEFGELASRATMASRPEFGVESRSRVLPVDSLWTQFSGRLFDPFHLTLCLFAVAHLAKAAFRLPRGLASLLLASVVMYVLADIFVMRFYFPSRYVYFSLPLFGGVLDQSASG